MGSWSVYCGISNLAITAGDECVLLPLKNAKNTEYLPYVPASLPIFGKYDDYGGIEDIQKNENTSLMEEHFGITVEEIAEFLVDGKNTYNRDEAKIIGEKIQNLEEIKNWNFMWINKEVYDFMTNIHDEHTKGHIHFGNPKLMKDLGFEYIGEDKKNKSYDPKRFFHKWKHGDKFFLTDGWTMLSGIDKTAQYVYYVKPRGQYTEGNSLSNYIEIPENMKWISDKAGWQLWMYPERSKYQNLFILDDSKYDDDSYTELFEEILREAGKPIPPKVYKTLLSKYKRDYEKYAEEISNLVSIRHNLHPMSGSFVPYILYLTPQCGERRHHQVLLEKFAEINKSGFEEDEDDD